jgi:predicted kinase
MRVAYLTSGPRGSGKSTYVHRIRKTSPGVIVVDRDEICRKEFGSVSFDPYTGMHYVADELLNKRIKEAVLSSNENAKIIIDAWNGFFATRLKFIGLLRDLNVEHIVCWYFITPLDVCLKWFRKKTDIGGFSDSSCIWDYNLFHSEASDINYPEEFHMVENVDIDNHRFNSVWKINPSQLTLPGFALI